MRFPSLAVPAAALLGSCGLAAVVNAQDTPLANSYTVLHRILDPVAASASPASASPFNDASSWTTHGHVHIDQAIGLPTGADFSVVQAGVELAEGAKEGGVYQLALLAEGQADLASAPPRQVVSISSVSQSRGRGDDEDARRLRCLLVSRLLILGTHAVLAACLARSASVCSRLFSQAPSPTIF